MAARFGKLPLNDSPRTSVFRCIDDILRADPNLQRFFSKPGAFRSWRGETTDKSDFAQTTAPAIRLTPVPEGEEYWYPGQQKGSLTVRIELLVTGLCVDDVENLFYSIQRALVPSENTARLAMELRLKQAGAMLGQIHFTQPATDSDPAAGADGQFRAVGTLKTEVRTT